jgi:hypothetical protein
MTSTARHSCSISRIHRRAASAALALAAELLPALVATQSAQAQTSSVLHAFTGGSDGARPQAGLVHSGRRGIPLNYKDPQVPALSPLTDAAKH